MSKKVFLRTFGCQMNERDSELIAGMLLDKGYQISDSYEEADVILFNTCSVRQHAEDRVAGNLRKLASEVKKHPDRKIGVLGCMASRHGEKIFEEFPNVDIVVGPSNIYNIPELLEQSFGHEKVIAAGDAKRPVKGASPEYRKGGFSSFVNIMYGCDNYCSYCIVPHVRGREVSRPKKNILNEIKSLADRGFKEVTLLGQNVNSYGKGLTSKTDFPSLLESVEKIEGIERIRFTTSHPKDAGKKLFRAMKDLKKVCEHIHLPLQSGSNKILDIMNRKYTYEEYIEKVQYLRESLPDAGLTTDLIVGFPSEKEQDHEANRKALQELRYNSAFIFKYSPRPPALSSSLVDDVSEETKKRRNNDLLDLQKEISEEKNKERIGSVQEVLVEGKSRMSEHEMTGRASDNTKCVFQGGDDLVGSIVHVLITGSSPFTLKGELVGTEEGDDE